MTDTPVAILTRQRTVFRLAGHDDPSPSDAAVYSDGDERTFRLPADTFEDMGRPDTITLTVEPGDALNDLAGARDRVERARHDVVEQVREARRNRRSWADIGAEFGVSRQAAWESYAHLVGDETATDADAR
jgi:hypothetical protein